MSSGITGLLTSKKVVTLVTGAVKTPFWNNVEGGHMGIPDSSPYQPIRSKVEDMMTGKTKPDRLPSPEKWAKAVANDLLRSNPPSYVRRGVYATIMPIISWLCPSWLLRLVVFADDGYWETEDHFRVAGEQEGPMSKAVLTRLPMHLLHHSPLLNVKGIADAIVSRTIFDRAPLSTLLQSRIFLLPFRQVTDTIYALA